MTATGNRPVRMVTRLLAVVGLGVSLLFTAANGAQAVASPGFVFRIGTLDRSDAEFALNPDQYNDYPTKYPDDIHYVVGSSTPGQDWSYTQPGTTDPWAGNRAHPFTIQYDLDTVPDTGLRLSVFYLDIQDTNPPTAQVSSNGTVVDTTQLPAGSGRGIFGTGATPYTLTVDVPASSLQQGSNALTITDTHGSWTVFDAVELLAPPPAGTAPATTVEHVAPTPLIVNHDGAERQLVDVSVINTGGPGSVTFTATVDGQTETTPATVPTGSSIQRIPVPPAPGPGSTTLAIATDTGSQPFQTPLAQQRRWRVDIINGSHQDLGFGLQPPDVRPAQDSFLDQAIALCEKTASNPPDSRFRWTIEHAWQLDNYVKDRPASQLDRLATCMHNGQIDLGATYDNQLYGLDSAEQMARALYPGTRTLPEQLHVAAPTTALQDDDSAVTWSEIQALHDAAVKHLMIGIDPARAPQPENNPTLFWWKAPDGSKVLTWYGAYWYSEGYSLGLQHPLTDLPAMTDAISRRLAGLQQSGYGPDVYPIMMFLDNSGAADTLPDLVQKWNSTYVSPHLSLSTASGFFNDLTPQDLAQVPTYQGDWSDWWSDGSASSAHETALTRRAQDRTTSAETLGALAALHSPDAQRQSTLDTAYREAELYDEHTWGSPQLTWDDPQWPYKQAHADQADALSRQAMTSAVNDLGAQVSNQSRWPDIAVFNSTSSEESGPVTATVATASLGGQPFTLATGDQAVPYQITKQTADTVTVKFVARGVPALGYQTYELRPGSGAPAQPSDPSLRASGTGLENRYYKVGIDPSTGAISSIIDKTSGRELVDKNAPFQLNQYVYRPNCAGANKGSPCPTSASQQWSPSDPTISVTSDGPVAATVKIHYSGAPGGATTGVNGIDETITLYADLPRVDLHDTLQKVRVDTAEEGYYAFPFNETNPDITYAAGGTPVRFLRDQLPGAALDWQAIGNYADISNRNGGITMSTRDAPLVEFDHIRTQEFQDRPGRLDGTGAPPDLSGDQPHHGWMFSYIFNNLWYSNYRIAQAGPLTYDYSIGAHPGAFDPVRATDFGAGVHTPLQAATVDAGQDGSYPPGRQSFVSVAPQNVIMQTIKQPYGGQAGLAVRLREIAGHSTTATLRLPFPVGQATLDDVTERPQTTLAVHGDTVQVPLTANGLATVTVQPLLGLTAAIPSTTLARGTSSTLTATITNNTAHAVSPSLSVSASTGVTTDPGSISIPTLAPGATATRTVTVDATAGADLGNASVTVTAAAAGTAAVSTQLALNVVNPVDLAVTPSQPDLVAGHPIPVQITVTNNLSTKTTAHVSLQTPTGWTVAPQTTDVDLDPGQSSAATFTVTPSTDAYGRASLTGSAAGDWATTNLQIPATVSRPILMVGEVDRSTAEFALSPNQYAAYPNRFPNDVDFTAGTDNPATSWSYIQPGPVDSWAGGRPHTFTLHFNLDQAPTAPLTFTAWLVDNNFDQVDVTTNGGPPQSFQLPAGGGDGYHWGDGQPNSAAGIRPYTLNVPLPSDQLHAGENTLAVTLGAPSDSWIVYDAFGIRQIPQ